MLRKLFCINRGFCTLIQSPKPWLFVGLGNPGDKFKGTRHNSHKGLTCFISRSTPPTAADVPTLLGTGAFSLLGCTQNEVKTDVKPLPAYIRWPHMQADQVRGIGLREIGGGFPKHHGAPSVKFACYDIAKPSTMVQKMQDIKRLRGHRDAVYCGMVTTFLANFPEVTFAGTFCTWGIGRGDFIDLMI